MAGDKYAALRTEYVTKGTPLATIAEREGIPYQTLYSVKQRQDWDAAREEHIKNEEQDIKNEERAARIEVARNDAQERVQAREDANKRHRELALTLQGEIDRAVKASRNAQEPQKATDIRALAGALESAQRVERLALGMTTEAHEVQADVRHQDAFLDGDALIKELQARGLPVDVLNVDAA